jgi:Matrixin
MALLDGTMQTLPLPLGAMPVRQEASIHRSTMSTKSTLAAASPQVCWRKLRAGTLPVPAATVECDMRFSNGFNWYTGTGTPPANQVDWWSVAIHEMGHCLGLDHEPRITDPKSVMYPSLAAGEVRRTLTPDDIAGRNAIYGAAVPWTPVPGEGFTPSTFMELPSHGPRCRGVASPLQLRRPPLSKTISGSSCGERMTAST